MCGESFQMMDKMQELRYTRVGHHTELKFEMT